MKEGKKKSFGRILLTVLLTVVLILLIAAIAFFMYVALSTKYSSEPVGYWVIKEMTSNEVTMTTGDAEAIGLDNIGSLSLNESGKCTLTLMGKKFEGTWEVNDDDVITINCGEEHTLTATIDEGPVMTAHDESNIEYVLEK